MSAAEASPADVTVAPMAIATFVKFPLPSFSYQAMVASSYTSALKSAIRASKSPSPSKSAAYTDCGVLTAGIVSKSCCVKFSSPSFSCQAMPAQDAESTSMSPSPSMSAAYTALAFCAKVAIVWAVKFWLPSFSYQAMVLSYAAESTSKSPSPSTSAAWTSLAPSAAVVIL